MHPPCAQKTPSPRVARPGARAHSAHTLPHGAGTDTQAGHRALPTARPPPRVTPPPRPLSPGTLTPPAATHAPTGVSRTSARAQPPPARPPGAAPPALPAPLAGPDLHPGGPAATHRRATVTWQPAPAPPPRTTAPGSLRAAGGLYIPACTARRRAEGRSGCRGGRFASASERRAAASRERAPRETTPCVTR